MMQHRSQQSITLERLSEIISEQFSVVHKRLSSIDKRLSCHDEHFLGINEQIERLALSTANQFALMQNEMNERFDHVDDRFVQVRRDILSLHDLHADHELRISTLETHIS